MTGEEGGPHYAAELYDAAAVLQVIPKRWQDAGRVGQEVTRDPPSVSSWRNLRLPWGPPKLPAGSSEHDD